MFNARSRGLTWSATSSPYRAVVPGIQAGWMTTQPTRRDTLVKLQRYGLLAGLVAGALALTACGSDNATNPSAGGGGTSGSGNADCASGTLSTGGSTAQKPAMTAWIQAYQNKCSDAAVNYDSQGSGFGVTQFIQGQFPVGGSDSALKDEEQGPADKRCNGGTAVDIPMVATPVSIVYNLSGVDKLTVTPQILAKIYAGTLTKWNDPELARANPGVSLPDKTITAVHRSDDSGTTDNFVKFLDAQDKADWTFGTGKAWKAPGGVGGKGNPGVIQNVKGADGAIGYADGPDAKKNSLTPALLDVGAGPVEISAETVGKALSASEVTEDGQDIRVKINYGLKEAGAYPAILVTYEITCTKGLPADQATFVKSFLTFTASDEGQALLAPIGHLPLPDELISKVRTAVSGLSAA
jgi:phosphate transport system substrate-binding protein